MKIFEKVLIVCGLALCGVGLFVSFQGSPDAASGVIREAAYVTLDTTQPPIRKGESGMYAVYTSSTHTGAEAMPGWRKRGAYDGGTKGFNTDTALGGFGRRRHTSEGDTTDYVQITANDAGVGTATPSAFETDLTGNLFATYWVSAIAENGTDFAEWRIAGAARNTNADGGGTVIAVTGSNAIGTAIAPTNKTTGATFWRITPVNASGKLRFTFSVARQDGGVAPGIVRFYVEENTLP